MTIEITLTGTGVPLADAERAGPGVLVRAAGRALQFDAGRATAMRLAAAGVRPWQVDAVVITHHHSDHLIGLVDLVFCRWLEGRDRAGPLVVIAPDGPARRYLEQMLDPWQEEIELRAGHEAPPAGPQVEIRMFEPPTDELDTILSLDGVEVAAGPVRHEPVLPAVGYRIEHDGSSVAISGDTRVCDELERLATGVDVLVSETVRTEAIRPFFDRAPHLESICRYHADTTELGALAARAGVGTLVLTHLMPAPNNADDEAAMVEAVRAGGYAGDVIVGRDLTTITT